MTSTNVFRRRNGVSSLSGFESIGNIGDIEDFQKVSHLSVTDIYRGINPEVLELFVRDFLSMINDKNRYYESKIYGNNVPKLVSKHDWSQINTILTRRHHISPGTVQMNYAYLTLLNKGIINRSMDFERLNIAKTVRVNSGVVVITVLTSPHPEGQDFSCPHDCYYCPNEKASADNNWTDQPRSYLFNEPAVRRANRNGFDGAEQVWDRLSALSLNGHKVDKLEILVLGGTWSSYPESYQNTFVRDLYYAANVFFTDKDNRRDRGPLKVEKKLNESAKVRIIGLTLETRPDHITANEIHKFVKYGCTRVQIGVQHTSKRILSLINRGCYLEDTIRGIRNLKDAGFKVDIHLMPDLPGATPDIDRKMFNEILYNPDLQADQWKIYPCETTPFSKIEEWYNKGKYDHYSDEDLMEVIMEVKSEVHPWIRLNRVIRDIPNEYILDGNSQTNLRQVIQKRMKERGWSCKCIRCREVKNKKEALDVMSEAQLFVRQYEASGGEEYFISFESPDNKYIYGFCRLRITPSSGYITDIPPRVERNKSKKFQEQIFCNQSYLTDTALIRELHVYGEMTPVDSSSVNKSQHMGFGKKLMARAEEIAVENGYTRVAVISGVGVRGYYRKLGYKLSNNYMIKDMIVNHPNTIDNIYSSIEYFLGIPRNFSTYDYFMLFVFCFYAIYLMTIIVCAMYLD